LVAATKSVATCNADDARNAGDRRLDRAAGWPAVPPPTRVTSFRTRDHPYMRNAAISAFRARPNSVCVRLGLAGWGGRILADLHRNPVILNAQPNLLGQISTEEVGPSHRSLVRAGAGDKAVGEAGIKPRMSGRDDANERIRGTHARIKRLASHVSFEMMA